jgi:hypothetical protein
MGGVIDDAQRHTDHLCHALPGPHRATAPQVGRTRPLFGSQPPERAGRGPMASRVRPAWSSPRPLLTDGGGAHPQGLAHVALGPALVQAMPDWPSACGFPVVRSRVQAEYGSLWLLPC